MEQMGIFDAMYTQRAIRRFRPDPVPEELLLKVIEAATKAPNGGNRQPWGFVVVQDPEKKKVIAEIAQKNFAVIYQRSLEEVQRTNNPDLMKAYNPAKVMVEEFPQTPAFIFVCLDHGMLTGGQYKPGDPIPCLRYATIYPAVQNLLLAARALGLGAVLTTGLHSPNQDDIRKLLEIPPHVEPVVMVPIGYPGEGAKYGPTTRRPAREVTHWDRWGEQR